MAAQEQKTKELPVRTSANTSDKLVFVSNYSSNATANSNSALIGVGELFSNTANLFINVQTLRVVSNLGTPANSTAANVQSGVLWSDGTYLYYSTANNHVKRVSGSDF